MSQWDQARDSVCHKCDSGFYKKVNKGCEDFFYRLGVLTAIYAPAILVFCLVLFGGLGLGIYQANMKNDLYYLWIESGSRLLGERAYTAEHHSGGATRAGFQIFSSKDESSNAVVRENLPFIIDTIKGGLSQLSTDDDLGPIGWHDICDRIPTPPALYGFMRAFGAKGFPCNKFAPTDCFKEGELGTLGFDLPDPFLTFISQAGIAQPNASAPFGCCDTPSAPNSIYPYYTKTVVNPSQNFSKTNIATCLGICAAQKQCVAFESLGNACTFYTPYPTLRWSATVIKSNPSCAFPANYSLCFVKNPQFNNKYVFQKSYQNMTTEDILTIAGTPSVCTSWIGVQLPENFLFGGVQRTGKTATAPGTVVKIPSTEMLFQLKAPAQYAKAKCITACVTRKGCVSAVQLKFAQLGNSSNLNPPSGSCQAGVIAYAGTTCVPQCIANNTYALSQVGVNATTLNQSLVQQVGLYCYNATGMCAPLPNYADPACGSCLPGNPYKPNVCDTNLCAQAAMQRVPLLAACIQLCATPSGSACVGGALAAATACELNCTKECANPDDDAIDVATRAITSWETNFINYMATVVSNSSTPYTVDYFTERSISDLVNAAGAADEKLIVYGYVAMILFGMITLFQWDTLQSRLMLGLVGMFLVIVSIVGALGFSAIVGIPFVPTIVQVMPFLALGLGTYDMFVMAFAYHYIPEKTIPAQIGELLKETGPRLLLTATTNIIVFGIGASIPLRAVNLLSGAMCIVIFFNFLILVFGFGALIALNAERIRKNKTDCICCMPARYKSSAISAEKSERIGNCQLKFAEIMFWKPVQVFVLVASIIIFSIAMWGITKIEIGLPLQDIVPKDVYAYGWLKARGEFYGSGSSWVVTGFRADVSYDLDHTDPHFLADMVELEKKLSLVKGTDPSFPIWSLSWVDTFLFFCAQAPKDPVYGWCAKNISASDPVIAVVGATAGVRSTIWSNVTAVYPNKATFPYFLGLFLAGPGLNSVQYLQLSDTNSIISSRIPYFQTGLDNDQAAVDYILATRAVTDACPQPVYPSGNTYDLYEQYVKTKTYMGTSLGYTCIGVLLIISVFLLHPGATLIMFAIIVLTVAEIYGFLAFFDLKLNGVSVVNMIMAIGVVVAPVAHITRVFMVSHGTNAARAEHALALMTFPMLFSTISTFLGEFPLEFARFPYFRLYFFHQYVIIGIITLINSFLPLPLLLAYFGPPPLSEEGTQKAPAGYEKGGLVEIPGLEESTAGDASTRE